MTSIIENTGIQPIHIRFTTNSNPSNENLLTRDMIHIPDKKIERESDISKTINEQKKSSDKKPAFDSEELSMYPFFTDTIRFPVATILALSKEDQIKLFFNKRYFQTKIGVKNGIDRDERATIADYNIRALLSVLLPTSFPVKNNIYETFSGNIKGVITSSNFESDSNIFDLLFSDKDNKYSYVNIEGKTWTVVKINLINDIINDKIFRPMIQSGTVFKTWKSRKIEEYKSSVDNLEKELSLLVTNKLPGIKEALTPEDGKSVKEQTKEAAKARMQLSSGPGNVAGVTVPTRFLIPHINSLFSTNDTQMIIQIFNVIEKLRIRSGRDRMENYIPLSIYKINGFSDLLKKSNEYVFIKELIEQLTSLKKIYEIIKNKKQDSVESRSLKEILRNPELQAFLDEINRYTYPSRFYSNKHLSDILQKIDTNIDEFLEFIDHINKITIENERPDEFLLSNEKMSERLKTGVMIVSEQSEQSDKKDVLGLKTNYHFDCLINLQLIDGMVDDDNIIDVKCPYRNQMLHIMYNNLKYAQQKNPVLFYIDSKPFVMTTTKGGKTVNKRQSKNKQKKKYGGYIGLHKSIRDGRTIKQGRSIKGRNKRRRVTHKKYSLRRNIPNRVSKSVEAGERIESL